MFKKVIGQSHSEATRIQPPQAETRRPEPVATPVAAVYSSQAAAPRGAQVATRNVLSADVEIKGTVKFTNDLVVDGKIEGEIFSDGNLIVGENARIRAEVKTATVIIYGKVHGNLTATDRIELKSTAEVVGDIKAKILSIEAGAIFVGKSTVGTAAQAPAQTQAPTQAQAAAQTQSQAAAQAPVQSPAKVAAAEMPRQGTLAGTQS
jgi:cytoskeletal protein CcmA (bactofilin family)